MPTIRERFDAEKRRILAASRNRFPIRPFEGDGGAGVPSDEGFILAAIDIDEPIWARAGESREVQFRYRAGDPQSTAFYIWWFNTLREADALENRLSPDIHRRLPITTITPHAPLPDTGDWQSGVVLIEVPDTYKQGFFLFGAMIIEQPDREVIDEQAA